MYDSRERIGAEYLVSWLLSKEPEVDWSLIQRFGELVQETADKSGIDIKVLYSDIQLQALLDNYSEYFVETGKKKIGYNKSALRIPH